MKYASKLISLVTALMLTLCLISCTGNDTESSVSALIFTRNGELVLDSGSVSSYLRVDGTDTLSNDLVSITSADESIAKVNITKISGHLIEYQVIPVSKGETYIYASTSDGIVTSEQLKVTVSIDSQESETATLVQSDGETELTADTYPLRKPESSEPETADATGTGSEGYYVINTNSKKIHYPHCSAVSRIKAENYGTTDDPESKLDEGYVWCKLCG